MFGRGATDDKGPILGWLNVLDAHHTLGLALPVNLRFVFEGMEESGSEGLDEYISSETAKGTGSYFHGVDAVCIVCPFRLQQGFGQVNAHLSPTTIGSIPGPPA